MGGSVRVTLGGTGSRRRYVSARRARALAWAAMALAAAARDARPAEEDARPSALLFQFHDKPDVEWFRCSQRSVEAYCRKYGIAYESFHSLAELDGLPPDPHPFFGKLAPWFPANKNEQRYRRFKWIIMLDGDFLITKHAPNLIDSLPKEPPDTLFAWHLNVGPSTMAYKKRIEARFHSDSRGFVHPPSGATGHFNSGLVAIPGHLFADLGNFLNANLLSSVNSLKFGGHEQMLLNQYALLKGGGGHLDFRWNLHPIAFSSLWTKEGRCKAWFVHFHGHRKSELCPDLESVDCYLHDSH